MENQNQNSPATQELVRERTAAGRTSMKCMPDEQWPEDYQTDQQLRRPQPPLFKPPLGTPVLRLPRDFESLRLNSDFLQVLNRRKSSRVYTQQPLTLQQLSFLLWATQGVKGYRGKKYATLRTVPCGGARHEFECYLTVCRVEGLEPGRYHYMPDLHALEWVAELGDLATDADALCGQSWAVNGSVIFYYSCLPYRAEWRYGIDSYRCALIDAGHITENLYLACSALGDMGTCALGSVDSPTADALFRLDGEEEFIFYAAPVGGIDSAGQEAEDAFYAFVREQDL